MLIVALGVGEGKIAELLTENLPTVSENLPPTHMWQAAAYATRQTCA